jgi:hypothetical protein
VTRNRNVHVGVPTSQTRHESIPLSAEFIDASLGFGDTKTQFLQLSFRFIVRLLRFKDELYERISSDSHGPLPFPHKPYHDPDAD